MRLLSQASAIAAFVLALHPAVRAQGPPPQIPQRLQVPIMQADTRAQQVLTATRQAKVPMIRMTALKSEAEILGQKDVALERIERADGMIPDYQDLQKRTIDRILQNFGSPELPPMMNVAISQLNTRTIQAQTSIRQIKIPLIRMTAQKTKDELLAEKATAMERLEQAEQVITGLRELQKSTFERLLTHLSGNQGGPAPAAQPGMAPPAPPVRGQPGMLPAGSPPPRSAGMPPIQPAPQPGGMMRQPAGQPGMANATQPQVPQTQDPQLARALQNLSISMMQLKTAILQNHTMASQIGRALSMDDVQTKREALLKHLEHAQSILGQVEERQQRVLEMAIK